MFEERRDKYLVSSNETLLNITVVHDWLSNQAWWSKGRSYEDVVKSINNSIALGLYDTDLNQVGFCRVVTDRTTFAWLCDVFIEESSRGKGLGIWLSESAVKCVQGLGVYRIILLTPDAHGVYERAGFNSTTRNPKDWMEIITERINLN